MYRYVAGPSGSAGPFQAYGALYSQGVRHSLGKAVCGIGMRSGGIFWMGPFAMQRAIAILQHVLIHGMKF